MTPVPAAAPSLKKITPASLARRKGGEPIVCLTAYTAPMARFMDPHRRSAAGRRFARHGDLRHRHHPAVTLDMMIAHGEAVMRGATRACVIVDMPFGTLSGGPGRVPQGRRASWRKPAAPASSSKAAGDGRDRALPGRSRHPGDGPCRAQPQSVNALGGYRAQGRSEAEAARVMADAQAIAEAGAFAHRDRGHGGAGGARDHRGRRTFPPSASAPRPPATGRFWSPRICSGLFGMHFRRNSSSATPNSAPR